MCRLIETIKISNDKIFNIDYHNRRLNKSRQMLFGLSDKIELLDHLVLPGNLHDGLYKCRLVYAERIESVEIKPYIIRPVTSLKLLDGGGVEYDHKFAGRTQIENLFAQRGTCDDVLIKKNGYVTDTSICNIALFNGSHWYTPERPLLKGTKRQLLLDGNVIFEKQISAADLYKFEKICLFNAMIEFGEIEMPVSAIQ